MYFFRNSHINSISLFISKKIRCVLCLKFIACLIAAILCLESIAFAAPEALGRITANISQNLQSTTLDLKIPSHVADIRDVYQPLESDQDNNTKTIYLVSDAHTNASGQMNMAKTLEYLWKSELGLEYVFLEGGIGDESLSELRNQLDFPIQKRVANQLLHQGIMNGAEYFDVLSNQDIQLWGVEDLGLYTQSLGLYKDIVRDRNLYIDYLKEMRITTDFLKTKVLNKDLMKLDLLYQSYENGDISWTSFMGGLFSIFRKKNLPVEPFGLLRLWHEVAQMESDLDWDALAIEQQRVYEYLPEEERLAEFFTFQDSENTFNLNKGEIDRQHAFLSWFLNSVLNDDMRSFLELEKYMKYLIQLKRISELHFKGEEEKLKKNLYQLFTQNADELNLLKISRRLELIHKLFLLQITSKEFRDIQQNTKILSQTEITGLLNQFIMGLKKYHERTIFLKEGFDEFLAKAVQFYALSYRRDDHFVDKMFLKMEENGLQKAALVVGGFHLQNLKRELRRRKLSYVELIPQVFHETNYSQYEKLLLNQEISHERYWDEIYDSIPNSQSDFSTLSLLSQSYRPQIIETFQAMKSYETPLILDNVSSHARMSSSNGDQSLLVKDPTIRDTLIAVGITVIASYVFATIFSNMHFMFIYPLAMMVGAYITSVLDKKGAPTGFVWHHKSNALWTLVSSVYESWIKPGQKRLLVAAASAIIPSITIPWYFNIINSLNDYSITMYWLKAYIDLFLVGTLFAGLPIFMVTGMAEIKKQPDESFGTYLLRIFKIKIKQLYHPQGFYPVNTLFWMPIDIYNYDLVPDQGAFDIVKVIITVAMIIYTIPTTFFSAQSSSELSGKISTVNRFLAKAYLLPLGASGVWLVASAFQHDWENAYHAGAIITSTLVAWVLLKIIYGIHEGVSKFIARNKPVDVDGEQSAAKLSDKMFARMTELIDTGFDANTYVFDRERGLQVKGILDRLRNRINAREEVKICYVCRENVFRSQVAHALTEQLLSERGIRNVSVSSGGVKFNPDKFKLFKRKIQMALRSLGVADRIFSHLMSQNAFQFDLVQFDGIFAASKWHKHELLAPPSSNYDASEVILFNEVDPELINAFGHRFPGDEIADYSYEDLMHILKKQVVHKIFEGVGSARLSWQLSLIALVVNRLIVTLTSVRNDLFERKNYASYLLIDDANVGAARMSKAGENAVNTPFLAGRKRIKLDGQKRVSISREFGFQGNGNYVAQIPFVQGGSSPILRLYKFPEWNAITLSRIDDDKTSIMGHPDDTHMRIFGSAYNITLDNQNRFQISREMSNQIRYTIDPKASYILIGIGNGLEIWPHRRHSRYLRSDEYQNFLYDFKIAAPEYKERDEPYPFVGQHEREVEKSPNQKRITLPAEWKALINGDMSNWLVAKFVDEGKLGPRINLYLPHVYQEMVNRGYQRNVDQTATDYFNTRVAYRRVMYGNAQLAQVKDDRNGLRVDLGVEMVKRIGQPETVQLIGAGDYFTLLPLGKSNRRKRTRKRKITIDKLPSSISPRETAARLGPEGVIVNEINALKGLSFSAGTNGMLRAIGLEKNTRDFRGVLDELYALSEKILRQATEIHNHSIKYINPSVYVRSGLARYQSSASRMSKLTVSQALMTTLFESNQVPKHLRDALSVAEKEGVISLIEHEDWHYRQLGITALTGFVPGFVVEFINHFDFETEESGDVKLAVLRLAASLGMNHMADIALDEIVKIDLMRDGFGVLIKDEEFNKKIKILRGLAYVFLDLNNLPVHITSKNLNKALQNILAIPYRIKAKSPRRISQVIYHLMLNVVQDGFDPLSLLKDRGLAAPEISARYNSAYSLLFLGQLKREKVDQIVDGLLHWLNPMWDSFHGIIFTLYEVLPLLTTDQKNLVAQRIAKDLKGIRSRKFQKNKHLLTMDHLLLKIVSYSNSNSVGEWQELADRYLSDVRGYEAIRDHAAWLRHAIGLTQNAFEAKAMRRALSALASQYSAIPTVAYSLCCIDELHSRDSDELIQLKYIGMLRNGFLRSYYPEDLFKLHELLWVHGFRDASILKSVIRYLGDDLLDTAIFRANVEYYISMMGALLGRYMQEWRRDNTGFAEILGEAVHAIDEFMSELRRWDADTGESESNELVDDYHFEKRFREYKQKIGSTRSFGYRKPSSEQLVLYYRLIGVNKGVSQTTLRRRWKELMIMPEHLKCMANSDCNTEIHGRVQSINDAVTAIKFNEGHRIFSKPIKSQPVASRLAINPYSSYGDTGYHDSISHILERMPEESKDHIKDEVATFLNPVAQVKPTSLPGSIAVRTSVDTDERVQQITLVIDLSQDSGHLKLVIPSMQSIIYTEPKLLNGFKAVSDTPDRLRTAYHTPSLMWVRYPAKLLGIQHWSDGSPEWGRYKRLVEHAESLGISVVLDAEGDEGLKQYLRLNNIGIYSDAFGSEYFRVHIRQKIEDIRDESLQNLHSGYHVAMDLLDEVTLNMRFLELQLILRKVLGESMPRFLLKRATYRDHLYWDKSAEGIVAENGYDFIQIGHLFNQVFMKVKPLELQNQILFREAVQYSL